MANTEQLFWTTPQDIVALTNAAAEGMPPLVPDAVSSLAGTGIEAAQGVMMKLKDESGAVIGLGTELEVFAANPDEPLEVYFTIMLPGRGTLFIHEMKRYDDAAEIITKVAETGEAWEGHQPIVSTVGPGPDGRGVILGGTGEFAGVSGSQSQTMTFRRVEPQGFPLVDTCETLTFQ